VVFDPTFSDPERLALAGFLAGYRGLPGGLRFGPWPVAPLVCTVDCPRHLDRLAG